MTQEVYELILQEYGTLDSNKMKRCLPGSPEFNRLCKVQSQVEDWIRSLAPVTAEDYQDLFDLHSQCNEKFNQDTYAVTCISNQVIRALREIVSILYPGEQS